MFNTIINWSIAAILASFTIMPISLNRQYAPAVEPLTEAAELKGCATKFANSELIPFYYNSNDYSQEEVEKTTNWSPGYPSQDCDEGDDVACMIFAHQDHVDNPSTPTSLNELIEIQASSSLKARVISVAGSSQFENKDL